MPNTSNDNVTYKILVHTGDETGAGTDSNIFLVMIGTKGESREIRLNPLKAVNEQGKEVKNFFERNEYNIFTLDNEKDIGDIISIRLRSDMMYLGADWLLDYIEISRIVKTNNSKNVVEHPISYFSYHKWIKDTEIIGIIASSGIIVTDKCDTKTEQIVTGRVISVPAGQTIEYSESFKVTSGYIVEEAKAKEISTNSSVELNLPINCLKATLAFATKQTLTDTQTESLTFEKSITAHATIQGGGKIPTSTESSSNLVYDILINRTVRKHTFTVGNTLIEVPEYLQESFAGLKLHK